MDSQNNLLNYASNLMKHGRRDQLKELLDQMQSSDDENFVSYMDYLIDKSGMKRSEITDRAGLSKDYMYKVLRGDKKTNERDYIIAICLAMKANLPETQKALRLYPFPELYDTNPRDLIIKIAINNGFDSYKLNDLLEDYGVMLLKTSPDMPSAKVGPFRSIDSSSILINLKTDERDISQNKKEFISMEQLEKKLTLNVAEHLGNAPFDFFYVAEYELIGNGQTVYAHACFWPDGEAGFVISKKSVADKNSNAETDLIEMYDSLEEASNSPYFLYFIELDRITDKKLEETMAQLNDTKYYGFRFGSRGTENGWMNYSEAYNDAEPEKNEYFQVRQFDNKCIYTVSHNSLFMQTELGDQLEFYYKLYFGQPKEELYVIETTSLDDLKEYDDYKSIFEGMVYYMNHPNEFFEKINGGNGDEN